MRIKKVYIIVLIFMIGNFLWVDRGVASSILCLRAPLIDRERLIKIGKQLVLRKLYKDLDRKGRKLVSIFAETLMPLKDGNITIKRIKELLSPQEERIYKIIGQIKEYKIRETVLLNKKRSYINFKKSDITEKALCIEANFCLWYALSKNLGLTAKFIPMKGLKIIHYIVELSSTEGDLALDGTSGQIFSENIGHIAVALLDDYEKKVAVQLSRDTFMTFITVDEMSSYLEKMKKLTSEFEEDRKKELLLILQSANLANFNL